MSRRRVSVQDLGKADCQSWLYKKKGGKGLLGSKWKKFWFVLKDHSLYWYTCRTAEKAEGYINLADFTIEPAKECKRKHAMKAVHPQVLTVLIAAESLTEMDRWMIKMSAVDRSQSVSEQKVEDSYSEASDHDTEDTIESCPLHSEQTARDSDSGDTPLPLCTSSSPVPESDPTAGDNESLSTRQSQDGVPHDGASGVSDLPQPLGNEEMDGPEVDSQLREKESTCDELESLLVLLQQARLTPTGQPKPSTQIDYRTSFNKRSKDETINGLLHQLRILNSTLKAKEADLLAIDQMLEDPTLTADKYRQWKLGYVMLLQEITGNSGPAGGSSELLDQAPTEPCAETSSD